MENELKEMKTKLDSMKRRKKEIVKELIELGVNVQKIKEVSKDDEERKEHEESERLEQERERLERERERLEQEREEHEESERLEWEREERERLEWQQLEWQQEERERIERERVEREQDTESEQDIVVTGIEEEEVSTMMQERVSQGLSCILPQQFHRFVTTEVKAAATETVTSETDLIEVEVTDEEIEVSQLTIPSPPSGEQVQQPAQQLQQVPARWPSIHSHRFQQQ